MERVHQIILNILLTKAFDKNIFNYIYPWGETLVSITWEIRASYHRTIMATPDQALFGRKMLFNIASVLD